MYSNICTSQQNVKKVGSSVRITGAFLCRTTHEGKKEFLNRAKEHEEMRDHAMRQTHLGTQVRDARFDSGSAGLRVFGAKEKTHRGGGFA